ncbi:MAG: hypothetical protein JWQ38_3536 [Flavipsychrobacter sp.]|nr:hypothetical protein [Flavipsychrobacter sp.]
MAESEIESLRREIKELKEQIKTPPKKSTIEKLNAAALPLATLILSIVGLFISTRFQNHQQEMQAKAQKAQLVKDFMPIFGDTSFAKTRAAMSVLTSFGYDSLAVLMALNLKTDDASGTARTDSALKIVSRGVPIDRKAVYYSAIKYKGAYVAVVPDKKDQVMDIIKTLLSQTQVMIYLGIILIGLIAKWVFN